jgi:hypothetical protein
MPPVEIDETELANFRNIQQVLAQIERNPQARALAQQAVSIAAPERAGPEIKLRADFGQAIGEIKEMISGFAENQKKEKEEADAAKSREALERRWVSGRTKARDAGYNTKEGLDALESFMEEKGIADHEVAIPAFERLHPPPEPVMTGGNGWNFFAPETKEAPDLKPLFDGNEDAFLGPAIANAINEVRNQR